MSTAEFASPPSDSPDPIPSGLPPSGLLPPGTRVDVRNTFDGRWTKGFEVLDTITDGYQLRRASDGCTLPTTFDPGDVRRERRAGTGWP